MYSYFAYGLRIQSALPLPELRPLSTGDEADLVIAPLSKAPDLPDVEGSGLLVGYRQGEVTLRWPYFGTYVVRGGHHIGYAPSPSISDAAARVPLLGVCMGVLLHQRKLLTLHASAVSIRNGAVVFVGDKGAGKSTTTAALVERGHGLLSDDVTAVAIDETGRPVVFPGIEAMKLWPDSLSAIGRDPAETPTLHEAVEKRVLRPLTLEDQEAQPLRCIYVLKQGEQVESMPVPSHQAFGELVRHTYAARFLGDAAASPTHFEQCTAVLRSAAVRKLVRPTDITRLGELVSHVESEWG